MINRNGSSWTAVEQIMTLAIGFFMWGWHIIGHFLFPSISYGFFVIGGPYFLMFIMIARIWWAIQFDGALKNVFTKKTR